MITRDWRFAEPSSRRLNRCTASTCPKVSQTVPMRLKRRLLVHQSRTVHLPRAQKHSSSHPRLNDRITVRRGSIRSMELGHAPGYLGAIQWRNFRHSSPRIPPAPLQRSWSEIHVSRSAVITAVYDVLSTVSGACCQLRWRNSST